MTPPAGGEGIGIDAKVAQLRRAVTYPERPAAIEAIETHMSWVFLTPRHAYKLKKPVRYAFLDFSTLEARAADCAEEVRLNRRLAADVYLDVVPLVATPHGVLRLGQAGEVVDWLVKMRRLPAERMLDRVIRNAALRDADVARVAEVLAGFFQGCRVVALDGAQYRAQLAKKIQGNVAALADPEWALPRAPLAGIHGALREFLAARAVLLEARAAAGRIVEGHGDLRPEHICLERRPVIFDCLEFNRDFRIMDSAAELAFLAMECERLGAPGVGRTLFEAYGRFSGDRPPGPLLDFYKANGALLRAKLAAWHIRDTPPARRAEWRARTAQYLDLARRYARAH